MIENSTLTALCSKGWLGIEVWGDPDLAQNDANQGVLVVKDSSMIENADIGILVGKRYSLPEGEEEIGVTNGGGIVRATHSIIRNNRVGVWFIPFETINESFFRHCQFYIDEYYYIEEEPTDLMKLFEVNRIYVHGCEFKNASPAEDVGSLFGRGNGIYSVDAYYLVEPWKDPQTSINYLPAFDSLDYGIKALGITSTRTFLVDSATFRDNRRGLYASNIDLTTVINNTFYTTLEESETEFSDTIVGLYMDYCMQFVIEANHFERTSDIDELQVVGCIINNSNADNTRNIDQVYRNYFEDQTVGLLAQNENRGDRADKGLKVKCNRFYGCSYDLAVTAQTSGSSMGISAIQGSSGSSPDAPAGNRFSHTGTSGTPTDINNEQEYITYYYHATASSNENQEPLFYTTSTVTKTGNPYATYDSTESCPPQNTGQSGGPGEEQSAMRSAEFSGDSVEFMLNTLVDGGSTSILLSEVDSSTSQSQQTYSDLTVTSPYVSDTVIEATVDNRVAFDNSQVSDVIGANRHAAKNDNLMQKVEQRMVTSDPTVFNQIVNYRLDVSAYEKLKSTLSHYRTKQEISKYVLLRYYHTHSKDSMLMLIGEDLTFEGRINKVHWLLESGRGTEAVSLLNSLPTSISLTPEETEYYTEIKNLIIRKNALISMGRVWSTADTFTVKSIESLFHTSGRRLAATYRNILLANDMIAYKEPVILPGSGNMKKGYQPAENKVFNEKRLFIQSIFPNPSSTQVTILLNPNNVKGNRSIQVLTIEGRIIFEDRIADECTRIGITTVNWASGIYIFQANVNGMQAERKSFSVVSQ